MSISLISVTKAFDNNLVLNNFSYKFDDGSKTVILGKSGCGKTTLLKLILSLEKPDSGDVIIDKSKVFSVLFQEDRLLEQCDALTNVKFVLKKSTYSDDFICDVLASLGIQQAKEKPINEFSGGMKRRVSICRALLYPCDVLIMDEPFRSLDNETATKIIPIINSFSFGKTVISVLHQPEFAKMLEAQVIHL